MAINLRQCAGVIVGEVSEAFDYAGAERLVRILILGEPEGDERKTYHLRGEGLGGGDAHLGAGVTVDATVHVAGDERVYHVDDADGEGGGVAEEGEAAVEVFGLARLRDENYGDAFVRLREVARLQFGRVDCFNGDKITQLFHKCGTVEGGVVGRAAAQEDYVPCGSELGGHRFQAS